MVRRFQRIAVIASAIALFPLAASAQGEDFQPSGVSLGNFTLSPSLRLSIGYDTNASFKANDSNGEQEDSTPTTGVNVGLGWAVPYIRSVDFSGDLGVGWTQNFAGEGDSRDASGVSLGGGLRLRFNPRGSVSFNIQDKIRIDNDGTYTEENELDPYHVSFDENGVDFGAERILLNTVAASLGFHPGGDVGDERMGFSGSLGASHSYNHYFDRSNLDRQSIGGNLGLNWNFLPRSAFVFRASVDRTRYDEDFGTFLTTSSDELSGVDVPTIELDGESPISRNDSTSARFTAGINGLLTEKLSVSARVGYGLGWYDDGPNPGQVLALLQLTGQFNRGHTLRGSYSTNFANASFANYVQYHKFVLAWELNRGRFGLSLSTFAQINKYSDYAAQSVGFDTDFPNPPGEGLVIETYSLDRTDYPVGANLRLRFAVTSNFQLGVQYRVDANFTDFRAVYDEDLSNSLGITPDELNAGDPSYVKHRILFFVRFAI